MRNKRFKKMKYLIFSMILFVFPFLFNATTFNKTDLTFENGSGIGVGQFVTEDDDILEVVRIKNDMIVPPNFNVNNFFDTYEAEVDAQLVGMVQAFAIPDSEIPTGWLLCDGREVSRATYSALFQRIGTAFGTPTNQFVFFLPDMRGYFVRGATGGSVIGNTSFVIDKIAAPAVGMGNLTSSSSGSHTHIFDDVINTHEGGGSLYGWGGNDSGRGWTSINGGDSGNNGGNIAIEGIEMTGNNAGSTGSHQHNISVTNPADTRPLNAGVIYVIKH